MCLKSLGMFRVDLHTHSAASHDGGISADQYEKALSTGLLDVIAITDHERIDFATRLKRKLGDRIIVGEEIATMSGEIIGLYLKKVIPSGLTPLEAIEKIKDQNGLVCIPHPFESVRKGLPANVMEELVDYIDMVEVCNGRAFWQNRGTQAAIWARLNHIIGVASSDAHGPRGLGKTYSQVHHQPSRDSLLKELLEATPVTSRPNFRSLMYPKYHKLRKRVRK